MNKFLVAMLATALMACGCGDKGSKDGSGTGTSSGTSSSGPAASSVVGDWTLDIEQVIDEGLAHAKAEMEKQFAEMEGEEAAMAKAMMPTPEKLLEMMRSQFAGAKLEISFAKDGTFTMHMDGMGEKEDGTGVWAQQGTTITATLKTKNGKPAEGEEAESKDLTFKDGKLSMRPEADAPLFYFRRK